MNHERIGSRQIIALTTGRRDKSLSIRGDMTAVDLKVFLVAFMIEPERFCEAHRIVLWPGRLNVLRGAL